MDSSFDPQKDLINRRRHKLSLAFGERIVEDDGHLIVPSIRPLDGEKRYKAVGMVNGVYVAGWVTAIHFGQTEQQR